MIMYYYFCINCLFCLLFHFVGAEIEVIYDAKVNILRCNGLLLEGLILSPDPSIQSSDPVLHWKKRAFVPFNSKDLKVTL